jgi:L,D-transpeptidase ErfK/SrfK
MRATIKKGVACACLLLSLWAVPGGAARAALFSVKDDTIGAISAYTVHEKESLYDISRRFDLGIAELMAANPGIDPAHPGNNTKLTIPTLYILPAQREGIIINLSELRLFYFDGQNRVYTFPVGIGRQGWETPVSETKIYRKRKNPSWTPPASIRAEDPTLPEFVPPGPDNPLGLFALDLSLAGYALHGTNRPGSIGKRSSHGCIRLYPEDIFTLFEKVKPGTPVIIVDEPSKLGWRDSRLLLEVMPTQQDTDRILMLRPPAPRSGADIASQILNFTRGDAVVDWPEVEAAIEGVRGIPTLIGIVPEGIRAIN